MHDTLMYVKKLEAVGVPRNQAEAQVEIMSQFVDSNFATKHDLKDVKNELQHEIREVKSELQLEIKEMVIKMGRMMAIHTTVTITVLGLFIKFGH